MDARPDGKAVDTAATGTCCPPIKSRCFRATPTMSLYTQIAPTLGTLESVGSGRTAFVQRAWTFPTVSAPSKVVRSTIEIAVSIAHRFEVALILLVASIAARAFAPT